MRPNGIIVAIDGPVASGKSTTAKQVAARLGYRHLNTGAMYRAFALAANRGGVTSENEAGVESLLSSVQIGFDSENHIFLNGENVSLEILQPEIASLASTFSSLQPVRQKLVAMQQEIGNDGGVVLEGRDIGTVVFPNAELKIFLVADPLVRAKRRQSELAALGNALSLEELTRQITERDERDMNRASSPLRKAADAIELDTSDLTFEQQIERVYQLAIEHAGVSRS